ncbi:MAG: ABC transporter permease [Dysgonamonadaceae bacterium]|jgi:ABC-2 type transport system permease protein|nr:ABC transporter permease [Dysgonamonadaceae bacterium]
MNKLNSLIYKDFLLLIRDRAGLCLMFLMPMLLVVIMTYLQDSTFNSINETRIPLLLVNNDSDSLGITIEKQIEESAIFSISRDINGVKPDRKTLEKAVAKGDFMIGILIPPNATNQIRKNVKRYVISAFNGQNIFLDTDSVEVEIYIDPVTKSSFRNTLMSTLREYAVRTESDFLFKEITSEVNKLTPVPIADIRLSRNQVIIKEQYASMKERQAIPNSVQHNIPAWSMFAIFFIAISLAGNIIKEREEGSFTRLQTMPCPSGLYILSKIITYMCVCLLQLATIFLMGMYLFPLLGLPALVIEGNYLLLLIMGACSAMAAIGYGVAIGKIATTHQQAAIFASVSVVILAAIGGIWIPVFVMPQPMQLLSAVSPLNWGLEGFYDLFFRNGNLGSILPECVFSLAFFAICIFVVFIKNKQYE